MSSEISSMIIAPHLYEMKYKAKVTIQPVPTRKSNIFEHVDQYLQNPVSFILKHISTKMIKFMSNSNET